MALRDSLSGANRKRIVARILWKMGLRPGGHGVHRNAPTTATTFPRQIAIFAHAGAPSNDNASYAPTGVGDLYWDETNDDVYRCTAYVSTTSHTWTKIVD